MQNRPKPFEWKIDVLRALWHIHECSDHVVVDGVEAAARFFHPDTVKIFDYETFKCIRVMTAAEFVAASGAPLDVPPYPPYLAGWITNGPACPTSDDPSTPCASKEHLDDVAARLAALPADSPLLARRKADDSW